MAIVSHWPQESWGAPLASWKVQSNGCTDYLGLFLGFSCAVICTIRTAFLPEAFEEQLQKQIAAAVPAATAAENKKTLHKKNALLLSPCPVAAHRVESMTMLACSFFFFSSETSKSQLHQRKLQLASHVISTADMNPLFHNYSEMKHAMRASHLKFPLLMIE